MRRTRRHKFLQFSVFFLIYSIMHVYSEHIAADKKPSEQGPPVKVVAAPAPTESKPLEMPAAPDPTESKPVEIAGGPTPTPESTRQKGAATAGPTATSDTSTEASANNSTTAPSAKPTAHPTWRPLRDNCTPPAIEQFPRPLMGPWGRKHGGLLIHVLVAVYTFLGLAIVCDEYFVASLDRICEELKMSPDVAGATFMAAGSSAPELATVIIGVFFAKDDIGVSGVIGSAVFNIMFVISVCALCSGTVSYLNWWPLVRDCIFYALSILVMLGTIYSGTITWGESLFMLIMYVCYCITLHFNPILERWAQTLPWVPCKRVPNPGEASALVSYKTLPDDKRTVPNYGGGNVSPNTQQQQTAQATWNNTAGGGGGNVTTNVDWTDPNAAWNATDPNAAWNAPDPNAGWNATDPNAGWNNTVANQDPNSGWNNTEQGYGTELNRGAELNQVSATAAQDGPAPTAPPPPAIAAAQDYYKPKDHSGMAAKPDPLIRPEDPGLYIQVSWAVVFPIHYMCRKTIPNCRTEEYKNWYAFTFLISMVWISFYSYFMVWMITIIGSTLGIPDTVMGLTFVAAGVSVPDALSSIAVIKEGYGDMAVSNAVGSNVFDILVCLGLPWFIQTAIIMPGSHVNVISKGLTYSTLSLLSTVVFLVIATHLNGWKLDKKLGIILMIWYLIFITFATLYELNVFGYLNPAECGSEY